jgi:hypothetical protein
MKYKNDEDISAFITAHDASRIAKIVNLEPVQFLANYPADFNPDMPIFRVKGKEFILGLDHKYEGLKFSVSESQQELREYEKIVEIWNRNFGEKGTFIEFLNFVLNRAKI